MKHRRATPCRRSGPAGLVLPFALAGALAASDAPLAAQQVGEARPGPVPVEDFGRWESFSGSQLSPDGAWLAVAINRVNDEDELRVHRVADPDSVMVVSYGGGATFSDDGRWLAFRIGVSEEERERLRERNQPVREDLGLVDLRTGERTDVEDVTSFAFSGDGRWLAMRRYPPSGGGEREAEGVDLVVRDLRRDGAGPDVNFGNVSAFAWQEEGPLLAMTIDAEGMAGNALRVWDADTGRLRTLDAEAARYAGLAWRDDADDVAVLRSVARDAEGEDAWMDTAHVAVAVIGVASDRPTVRVLGPDTDGFPADARIVPWQAPTWRDDGSVVFVGLQERVAKDAACPAPADTTAAPGGDEEVDPEDQPADGADEDEEEDCEEEDAPTVEIWHARDVDIVPTQKVQAGFDRRENHLSAWHLQPQRLVQLEDELTEDVQTVDAGALAIGLDGTPYDRERMFGPVFRDVYTIDMATGERERVLEGVQYFYGAGPEARHLLFLRDDQYHTYDTRSREITCITCGLGTSFVDVEDDHTVDQKPPFGVGGWLEDGSALLVYDDHDVWRVGPDGSGARRLTAGAEENVRHRRLRFDYTEPYIDPSEPQYFSLYDDWAETWGFGRSERLDRPVERLVMGEARYYGLGKADEADVYAYVVEDFEDSPDVFVGGPRLADATQVTRTNPFQAEYAWGRSELVEYVNEWGDTLQGALYYPAGWEEGRRYPMITYIYETRSNAVRAYDVPDQQDYYNFQRWVQDGYFVFQPDIVYRDRDPGVSAVVNIEPAVQAVVDRGLVDPERLGLIGHSWGGYQTTFFVTQSDLFAAAVAGAPLTNLFSMYLSVYWNSGSTDARIFEISQGRMEVPFWEDEEAYRRNSPVFHIEAMETPLLMAQGTDDGAVDFNQGVEFYNAARRADKDFVFLVYNDENHGLAKEENRLDYHRRINEWFAHYLKGEPAPAWIEEGVPFLDQPGGRAHGGR